jgi:hypothetical protein
VLGVKGFYFWATSGRNFWTTGEWVIYKGMLGTTVGCLLDGEFEGRVFGSRRTLGPLLSLQQAF